MSVCAGDTELFACEPVCGEGVCLQENVDVCLQELRHLFWEGVDRHVFLWVHSVSRCEGVCVDIAVGANMSVIVCVSVCMCLLAHTHRPKAAGLFLFLASLPFLPLLSP